MKLETDICGECEIYTNEEAIFEKKEKLLKHII